MEQDDRSPKGEQLDVSSYPRCLCGATIDPYGPYNIAGSTAGGDDAPTLFRLDCDRASCGFCVIQPTRQYCLESWASLLQPVSLYAALSRRPSTDAPQPSEGTEAKPIEAADPQRELHLHMMDRGTIKLSSAFCTFRKKSDQLFAIAIDACGCVISQMHVADLKAGPRDLTDDEITKVVRFQNVAISNGYAVQRVMAYHGYNFIDWVCEHKGFSE